MRKDNYSCKNYINDDVNCRKVKPVFDVFIWYKIIRYAEVNKTTYDNILSVSKSSRMVLKNPGFLKLCKTINVKFSNLNKRSIKYINKMYNVIKNKYNYLIDMMYQIII